MARVDVAVVTTSVPDQSLKSELCGMKLCRLLELQKVSTVMSFRPCPHESAHFWNRIFFIRDLRGLRPCSHEFRRFWNRIFFIRIRLDGTLDSFTRRSSLPRSRFVSSRSVTAVWKAISEAVHSELIQLAFHIGGFLLFPVFHCLPFLKLNCCWIFIVKWFKVGSELSYVYHVYHQVI